MNQHMASLILAIMSIDYLSSSLNKNFSLSFFFPKENKIGLIYALTGAFFVKHAKMSEKSS
jgi:hypothetical protein